MLKKKLLLALVVITAFVLLADKPFYVITKDGEALCGRCRVQCELKPVRDDETETTTWFAFCPNCGRSTQLTEEEAEFIKSHMEEVDETLLTDRGRRRERHDEEESGVSTITYIPIPGELPDGLRRDRPVSCTYCGDECSGDSLFYFDKRTKRIVPREEEEGLSLTDQIHYAPVCWKCAKKYLLFPDSSGGIVLPPKD